MHCSFNNKLNYTLRELQRLSETRCACRYLSLDSVSSTFDTIILTLQLIGVGRLEGNDKAKAIEAVGLHLSFKFLSCLIILTRTMGTIIAGKFHGKKTFVVFVVRNDTMKLKTTNYFN